MFVARYKTTVLNRVVSGPAKAAAAAVAHLGLPARLASDSGVRATALKAREGASAFRGRSAVGGTYTGALMYEPWM